MGAIQWTLEDYFFVTISEVKKFREGAGQKRKGFNKIRFDKQDYVTVTLTDHSEGHGVVKSVILRNPAVDFLAKIKNPELWEVRKVPVVLVTEEENKVERTFRVVYLKTPHGEALMSNSLETQLKNLATNSKIRVDGNEEAIVAYITSDGRTLPIIEETKPEADEAAAE